jgi:hypothetical protein
MTRLSCHHFSSDAGPLVAERDSLQPGNLRGRPVPPNRIGNWSLTRPAAAMAEGGWTISQARPVLLAAAGQEPFHTTVVCEHGTADRCAACGDGVEAGDGRSKTARPGRRGSERRLWNALRSPDLPVLDFSGGAPTAHGSRRNGSLRKTRKSHPTLANTLASRIKGWRLGVYWQASGM